MLTHTKLLAEIFKIRKTVSAIIPQTFLEMEDTLVLTHAPQTIL